MQQGQGENPIHPVAGGLQSEPTIADPDEDDMADDDNVEMRAGTLKTKTMKNLWVQSGNTGMTM